MNRNRNFRGILPRLKRAESPAHPPVRIPANFIWRALLGVGTVAVFALLMSVHFLPDRISMRVGDRSPMVIRATRSVRYIDSEATLRRKEFAADQVEGVYEADRPALAQAINKVSELFRDVRAIREDPELSTDQEKARTLRTRLGRVFLGQSPARLISMRSESLTSLEKQAKHLVEAEMSDRIRPGTDDLLHARLDLERAARKAISAADDAGILIAVGTEALRPNAIHNASRTDRSRHSARRAATPVWRNIAVGDVIIRPGDFFTQQHFDQCVALGLVSSRVDPITAVSLLGLAAGLTAIVLVYIRRRDAELYGDTRRLAMLAAISVSCVAGLKIFGAVFGVPLYGVQFAYLGMMMVVAAGMLLAVLLTPSLAMLVTALMSVVTGLILNHELRFSVMTLVSSLVGINAVLGIRDRSQLLRAALAVAAANVAMVWILGGLLGDNMPEMLSGSVGAAAAAIFAVLLFWFGIAVLEKPFGVLTPALLLELSAPDRPLLRELAAAAPGTYAHSIMVGNLSEAAADCVGADSLFCRVASYYHDIGKIRRPHCFVENQGAENIHDSLTPSLSALIISSHVRDGVHMSDQHRLPSQIRDIIAEHHGTSLIRYFYHQALAASCQGGKESEVCEEQFRYEGPRPRTRESGIIMLADTVEAAARSLERPTTARIQGLVSNLIRDKIADGQLDDCELTFRDIQSIEAAFTRILTAVLHRRMEYPGLPDLPPDPSAQVVVADGGDDFERVGAADSDERSFESSPGRAEA